MCSACKLLIVFFFTVFYLLDYINKSITVDGEKIRLIMADRAAAVKQLYEQEGLYIKAHVSWNFNCYMYIKDIQRT